MTEPIAISQLPAGDPVAGDEMIPAVQRGQTVRLPVSALAPEREFFYFQDGPVEPFVTESAWRKRAPVRPLSMRAWCAEPATASVSVVLLVDGAPYTAEAVVIPEGQTASAEVDLAALAPLAGEAAVKVQMTAGRCTGLGVRVTYR